MGDYIIFKEVATLSWPGSSRYRVRYFAGTELYGRWSDKSAEAQIEHMNNKARYERVDREMWEKAKAGVLNGYADESDLDAPVFPTADDSDYRREQERAAKLARRGAANW